MKMNDFETIKQIVAKIVMTHTIDNPIKSGRLIKLMNVNGCDIKQSSDLRDIVRACRMDDPTIPILSCAKGYYYPQCPADIEPCIDHLKSRSMSMLRQYKKLRLYAETFNQQEL